ncbi:MAG: ABC transporter permease, partial [Lachnospiraceae bacterium]
VFFLPLLLACVHLGFAFPLIRKILLAFAMSNVGLLIGVTVLCALLFAVFYVIMYVLTSRAYYRIVNGQSAD